MPPNPRGHSYRFTHDLIRETIERDLSAGRQQLLHRRIGEALEQEYPPPLDALAYHFARSDDDAKALRSLELAGDEAQQRSAHAAAADYFREALARLVPPGRLVEAAPLQEKLGLALHMMGQNHEAIAVLEQALETYQAQGDEAAVHRTAGWLAGAHAQRGTAHEVVERIVALAAPATLAGDGAATMAGGWPAALALWDGLFHLRDVTGAYADMLAEGQALARAGDATGNARLASMGHRVQGVALIFQGRLAEGIALVEQGVVEGLAGGDRDLGRVAEATTILATAHFATGALQRTKTLSRKMLALARSLDRRVVVALYLSLLGTTLYVEGQWDEGRAALREADDLYAAVPPSTTFVRSVSFRTLSLIWEGEWEEARRYLERVGSLARSMHAVGAERQVVTRLAELDLLAGQPAAAVARLEPLAGADFEWTYAVPLLSTLAAAHLELGEGERAATLAQRAVVEAERTGTRLYSVTALRIKGLVDARQGRAGRARESFEEGLRRARAMPFPYAEAQFLEASARFERAHGDLELADQQLQAALAIVERLGARRDVERLRAARQIT